METIYMDTAVRKRELNRLLLSACFVAAVSYASEEFIPGRLNVQKALLVFVVFVGILDFSCIRKKPICTMYWRPIILFTIPFCLSAVYTMVLCYFQGDGLGIVKQAVTTTLFLVVDLLVTITIAQFFGKRTVKVMALSLVGAYLYAFVQTVRNNGLESSIKSLLSGMIERNDIGIAVVPLLLYYFYGFFVEKRTLKRDKFLILLLLIVMVFCGKRSAFLSLAVGVFLILIVKHWRRKSVCIMRAAVWTTVLMCWLYIICIHSDALNGILADKGTISDRLYVWKWFDNMYELSPRYVGKGFNFVHRYMLAGLGSQMVNDYKYLHNTILQLYIETGFYGFCVWIGIYLLGIPRVAMKKIGKDAYCFTVISVLAMFAIFIGDNALTYPLYQICLYCSLYSVYHYEKAKIVGVER